MTDWSKMKAIFRVRSGIIINEMSVQNKVQAV